MANIKIKFDGEKLKKELQKKIENITYNSIIEEMNQKGEMLVLQKSEEEVLLIILERYIPNSNRSVSGDYNEFPPYMKFGIKNSLEKLKRYRLFSICNIKFIKLVCHIKFRWIRIF